MLICISFVLFGSLDLEAIHNFIKGYNDWSIDNWNDIKYYVLFRDSNNIYYTSITKITTDSEKDSAIPWNTK